MYGKLTFAKTFGASLGVLLLVVAVGVYGGLAYAVPVAGVGGFTITADSIQGQDATVYPEVGETGEQASTPVAVVELESTTIEGLKILKPVDFPGLQGKSRVVIAADGTVHSDALLLKASGVFANNATLTGLEIDENPADKPSQEFVIEASADEMQNARTVKIQGDEPGLRLQDPELATHYLVTNRISIPGISIELQRDADGDGTFAEQAGNTTGG